jgi:NADPH:quinone reductase-like Zn-dependent oxidoreductase
MIFQRIYKMSALHQNQSAHSVVTGLQSGVVSFTIPPQCEDIVADRTHTASTTTGLVTLQLAKLAGLRVICVADAARHGAKLLESGADLLVDRHDTQRAVEIIRGVTGGKLRYAIDIVGKDTAALLEKTLDPSGRSHLLGLTGLPKERNPGIRYHTVPIKLFHTAPTVGESMVRWLEDLLESKTLTLPEIVRAEGGLEGINAALDLLRSGSVSGKRIVVGLDC